MTKKDFELIANVLKQARLLCNEELSNYDDDILFLDTLSKRFSDTLASKNPRFNKDKFLIACGLEIDKDLWKCKECNFSTIWTNYKDGNPICPNCDIDLVQ